MVLRDELAVPLKPAVRDLDSRQPMALHHLLERSDGGRTGEVSAGVEPGESPCRVEVAELLPVSGVPIGVRCMDVSSL